jgi:hypothetical protein
VLCSQKPLTAKDAKNGRKDRKDELNFIDEKFSRAREGNGGRLFDDPQMTQQVFRGEQFHFRAAEIFVVRPDWDSELESEREQLGVVRIPTADPAKRLGQSPGVAGAFDDGYRQRGDGENQNIDWQALLAGQDRDVFFDFREGVLGSENLVNFRMPKQQPGAASDHG